MALIHDQVSSATDDKSPRDQKRWGRFLVGVISFALSWGYLLQAWAMPRGDITSPGPGMFPVGVGLAAVVISAIVIVESFVSRRDSGPIDLPTGHRGRQAIAFAATLVAFVLILPFVGQYIAASLYVVATLRFMGGLSWVRSLIFGIAMGLGVSLLFTQVLSIQLPSGAW